MNDVWLTPLTDLRPTCRVREFVCLMPTARFAVGILIPFREVIGTCRFFHFIWRRKLNDLPPHEKEGLALTPRREECVNRLIRKAQNGGITPVRDADHGLDYF